MQPDTVPPNSGRVAFRYGLIIGSILAVVEAIIQVITAFYSVGLYESMRSASSSPDMAGSLISLAIGIVGFLLGLTAYFVAGILSARQTGRTSTGVFAGMWVGAFYGVIDCIVSVILLFTVSLGPTIDYYNRMHTSTLPIEQFRTVTIATGLIGSLIGIALAVGYGAGLGALGGLIGKRSPKAPRYPQQYSQPYPQQPVQFYTGQPYPGQPVQPYPGQPVQPGQPGLPRPPMMQYPAQGYPGQPYGQPMQQAPQRTEDSEGAGKAGNAREIERTEIDRAYRPPQQADQAWSGAVPQPGSAEPHDLPSSEPENPYSD